MNNYDLHMKATELRDTRTAYSLARELVLLKAKDDPFEVFEDWFMNGYPKNPIEKRHLVACRAIDENGTRGYEGLDRWYSSTADITLSASIIAWEGGRKSVS